ncbi:MAG: hypothetical protein NXH83_19330 [Rhodobacteraceae bacterium]|nr:hypothetical protein [Paracoccaceae bacterium]
MVRACHDARLLSLRRLQAAIALADRRKPRVNRRKSLSPDWQKLWVALTDSDQSKLSFGLSSFVFFLSRSGVAPKEVRDEHAAAFRDELMASRIRKDPEATYRKAVQTWNRARARLSFWPQRALVAPSRQRVLRIDLAEAPESFRVDLDGCLGGLARPDPFDEDEALRPLKASTIKAHRDRLLLFAGALVASGVPIGQLTCLAVLVEPAHARAGLKWMLARSGDIITTAHVMIAETLWTIACRHVRPPAAELKDLQRLRSRIRDQRPRRRGLTEKNIERLRPFRDPETMARFLSLPEELFKRGLALGTSPKGLLLQRDAIMLAILRNHPIRRKNLLALRLDTHLDRSANGRTYLVVAEKDVKNRRGIEFEVDPALWDMIERHVALRSAAGRNPACPWLFPDAAGDGPLHESYVSSRLSRVIARELGVAFNMHLARHLAAYLFLLKKPGHYEAVRRLLAHSSTSVTLDAYAGFETDSVGRQYGDFIAEACRQGGTGRDR